MCAGYGLALLQRFITVVEQTPTREQYSHFTHSILSALRDVEAAVSNVETATKMVDKHLLEDPRANEVPDGFLPPGLYRAEFAEGAETGSLVMAAKKQNIPLPNLLS